MKIFETWKVINSKYLESVQLPEIYIGCMTGTSADKYADFTLVVFDDNSVPAAIFDISHEIPDNLLADLNRLSRTKGELINISERSFVEANFSEFLSQTFLNIIEHNNLTDYPKDKIILSPHGQTIEHSPLSSPPYCDIIVNGDFIAKFTGHPVVTRHRQQPLVVSMAAPLAPVLLRKLFYNKDIDTVILNGGGIANICVLFREDENNIHGYDTGPANGPVDAMVEYIIKNCQNDLPENLYSELKLNKFDNDGKLAASGKILPDLLNNLLAHEYFERDIKSKSADRSCFDIDWILSHIKDKNYNIVDILSTVSEAVAKSIADCIISSLSIVPINSRSESKIKAEVLVYGGLAKNKFIINRIFYHLDKAGSFRAKTLEQYSPDYFESLLMGYLGYCAYNRISVDLSYCSRDTFKAHAGATAVPGCIAYP